jgi:uncharacterized protein (DUF3820 family)
MRYAYNAVGKEIDACELSSTGYIRSDTYKCIYCGKHLHFVSESDRCKPHFRHRNDESCIEHYYFNRQQKEQDICDIISNRKSHFHIQWQNLFPKECVEVKFQGKIADVRINLYKEWQLKTLLTSPSSNKLFIEVQHSSISKEEVERRVSTYITDTSSLLWIIDISSCLFHIDHIVLLDSEHYRLRFPKEQPSCLRHLLNLYYQRYVSYIPWVILDSQKQLFLIKRIPKLDCQFLEVYIIKWEDLVDSFNNVVVLNKRERTDVVQSNCTLNYKDYIISLDVIQAQNEVNRIVEILENTPFTEIQDMIDDIYCYLSTVTNKSKIIYKMLNLWLDKYKTLHFSEPMSFGKYQGEPLKNLSDNYIDWVINNCKRMEQSIQDKLKTLQNINKKWLYEKFLNSDKYDHDEDYHDMLLMILDSFARTYNYYKIEKLTGYCFIDNEPM